LAVSHDVIILTGQSADADAAREGAELGLNLAAAMWSADVLLASIADDGFALHVESDDVGGVTTVEEGLEALASAGVVLPTAEVWFDGADGALFLRQTDRGTVHATSVDELATQVSTGGAGAQTAVDYGQPRDHHTACLRLKVAGRPTRERLAEVFDAFLRSARSPADVEQFEQRLRPLFQVREHVAEWARFRWKDQERWFEGPRALIGGLRFVVDDGAHLVLGFDIRGVPGFEDVFALDDTVTTLLFSLHHLRGVSRVWLKARLDDKSTEEAYSTWPFPTDAPVATTQPLTAEDDWPPM
jgi:hypothetical protein